LTQQRPHVEAVLRNAALVALMFMLVYNISFKAAPSLTTGRLAIAILIGWGGWTTIDGLRSFVRANWTPLLAFGAAAIYALVLFAIGGAQDSGQVSRLLHFLVLSVVGAEAFGALVRYEALSFSRVFSVAVLLQAVLILYSYVSPGYRLWLSGVLVQGGGIPLTYALQVPGFSNSSGAALSAVQGVGVFSSLFSMRYARTHTERVAFALAAAVTVASTLVTGRTGLIMAAAFLVVFGLAAAGWRQRVVMVSVVSGLVVLLIAYGDAVSARLLALNPSFANTLSWGLGVFGRGTSDPVLNDLASQPVPPLTLATLLGTGLISDAYGNVSQNDSGYIQTYYALGLLMTLVFYGALLALLLKYVRRSGEPFLLGALVASIFVAELKEPFIFKYALPLFAIGLVHLQAVRHGHVRLLSRSSSA
jgi:hypothetical protein